MTTAADALHIVLQQMDELLCVGYPHQAARRQQLCMQWLHQEMALANVQVEQALSQQQWLQLVARCRYYAAQDLLQRHCARQPAWDADQREDLLLYLQDQLMRRDFHRLKQYQQGHGASLKTWLNRVLDNLTRDFLRRAAYQPQRKQGLQTQEDCVDAASAVVAEQAIEDLQQEQLQQILSSVFAADIETKSPASSGLHARLQRHLKLKPSEQLFLRMMYYSGLQADEAGAQLSLSKHQAYGLHRRLLERIAAAAKQAGIYQDLQDLLQHGAVQVEVHYQDRTQRVAPERLRELAKVDAHSCTLWWVPNNQSQAVQATSTAAFGDLIRQLYGCASLIQNTELVIDQHIADLDESDRSLRLQQTPLRFVVDTRYIRAIRALLRQNDKATA